MLVSLTLPRRLRPREPSELRRVYSVVACRRVKPEAQPGRALRSLGPELWLLPPSEGADSTRLKQGFRNAYCLLLPGRSFCGSLSRAVTHLPCWIVGESIKVVKPAGVPLSLSISREAEGCWFKAPLDEMDLESANSGLARPPTSSAFLSNKSSTSCKVCSGLRLTFPSRPLEVGAWPGRKLRLREATELILGHRARLPDGTEISR